MNVDELKVLGGFLARIEQEAERRAGKGGDTPEEAIYSAACCAVELLGRVAAELFPEADREANPERRMREGDCHGWLLPLWNGEASISRGKFGRVAVWVDR